MFTTLLAIVILALTALSSVAQDNFPVFYASSDVRNANGSIQALFQFWGTADRQPTFVKVRVMKGLFNAANGGIDGGYAYHIHTNPVSADGNCTVTLAHLDPFNATESFVCGPAFPQYCQEGDLSGKHGKLNGTDDGIISNFGYSDAFLRFFPQDVSILGRSIVIHSVNKTRIACGNITSQLDGTADGSGRPTYLASNYVTSYPARAPPNPPQTISPFNGTTFPSNETINSLPFPLAIPAIPLKQSVNIQLQNTTRTVTINGNETIQVTQPEGVPAPGSGPFAG